VCARATHESGLAFSYFPARIRIGRHGGCGLQRWAWGLELGMGIVNCVFTPQA
jgi:hypothetical protein